MARSRVRARSRLLHQRSVSSQTSLEWSVLIFNFSFSFSPTRERAGERCVNTMKHQVERTEKRKTPKGRARKRILYTRRFVNVTMTGGKRKVQMNQPTILVFLTASSWGNILTKTQITIWCRWTRIQLHSRPTNDYFFCFPFRKNRLDVCGVWLDLLSNATAKITEYSLLREKRVTMW